MATRPVWLAAMVPEGEEAAVIAAHRAALLLAHRLLLILVPENPARAEALAAQMTEREGWTVALRAHEEEPEPETEVYIVDNPQEFGLWYRLAPVTFLGGTLAGQGALRSPMEPAALGSAILHGPRTGAHGAAFGRLGAARAARAVASANDLAEALGDLLAPDRAARLAQAAWAVTSEGAEATERVLGLIRRLLDGEA
jgi:3-deoxy-D-manno-octulosonic-acid transferase